jgi:hypothetical protein
MRWILINREVTYSSFANAKWVKKIIVNFWRHDIQQNDII